MNKTLVVVPTYNERENLRPLAQRLLGLPVPVDLLVVDDNSPDGTGKLADELAAEHSSVHVLHRPEKSGLGRAYIAGFKWALERGYEFVFELDGDFSHNPDDIPMFLEAAHNADLVLGSRYINGIRIMNWPLSRLMLSKCAATYVRIITGMPFTDPTGGYKCFRRRALEACRLDEITSNGYSFQIEMTHKLWRQGLRVVEVPIVFHRAVSRAFQDVRPHHPRGAHHGLAPLVPKQDAPPPRRPARETAIELVATRSAASNSFSGRTPAPDDALLLRWHRARTAHHAANAKCGHRECKNAPRRRTPSRPRSKGR